MSGWGGAAPGRRTLQFVAPAPPPAPPAAPAEDDDVWGEELPEEALEEAMLLESQQLAEPRSAPPAPARTTAPHRQQQQQRPAPALVPPSSSRDQEPRSDELQRLRRDNRALTAQLETAKADKYSHQGEVSVLREELTRRCRELENCRLESSRQLQEQQQQLEQSQRAATRQLDALKSELQFKNHELSEVARRASRRDAPCSPPRKAARLGSSGAAASPAGHRRFITSSEFRKPETNGVRTETAGTQTETDASQTDLGDAAVPGCHLASAVLQASGDAGWLGSGALSALAALADHPGYCAERAGRAADSVAAAAAHRLAGLQGCVERLQAATEADRRLCALGSGRRRAAALSALRRDQSTAVTALAALRCLAGWGGPLSERLAGCGRLRELLPRLMRPAIDEGEVRNTLTMEYTAALLATMADHTLPDSLIESVEPAVHEVFNTKPPARLLTALLELLVSAAGTGQIGGLWCRVPRPAGQRQAGTCLVKKLSILFCERVGAPQEPQSVSSYRLPASHSRHGPVATPASAAAALRSRLCPEELNAEEDPVPPAVDPTTSGCPWRRLVALVMSRPSSLPVQPCCRSHLTHLVVQLLHEAAHSSGEHDSEDASSGASHLISALHRLADLDPAFSVSVSRERLRYLTAMETLGRRWREMRLSAQHVGVLQELYKFEPGTFDVSSQSQPA